MSVRQSQFEALVNAYSSDLYRYAVWLCRDSTQAEDLVQETFARAWRALDSLNDHRAAKGWLITILRREFARICERFGRDPLHMGDSEIEKLSSPEFSDAKPETIMLRRALLKLGVEYREPLLLQVIGGYSGEEIAAMLEIKPGAVMTRLFRARQQLRQALSGGKADGRKEGTSG
ncbi:MAG: sigma-70 family RNA polymerase sigma factor [Acidiferrobacterales bacterium]